MKKILIKNTKEEVKMGGTIVKPNLHNPNKGGYIIVNDETIPELLKKGIIEIIDIPDTGEQDYPTNRKVKTSKIKDLEHYAALASTKINAPIPLAVLIIAKMLPAEIQLSMILKEIAIELDRKYPDHISDSEEIYTISSLDGTIVKINKAKVKSYRTFAAFRTIEDARIACMIVKGLIKSLFNAKK